MTDKPLALITGITGQDGSYLAEFLLDKGYDVVGLPRRSTHYHHENIGHLAGKITIECGDLLDPHHIEHLIAKGRRQAQKFSWARTAQETKKVYAEVIRDRGGKG